MASNSGCPSYLGPAMMILKCHVLDGSELRVVNMRVRCACSASPTARVCGPCAEPFAVSRALVHVLISSTTFKAAWTLCSSAHVLFPHSKGPPHLKVVQTLTSIHYLQVSLRLTFGRLARCGESPSGINTHHVTIQISPRLCSRSICLASLSCLCPDGRWWWDLL